MNKNKYHFETSEFGLSDNGVHLLRSRYNYDTIEYSEIASAVVEKDKELNNWLIILMIGIGLVLFSIYYVFRMYQVFNDNEVSRIYIEEILVPVIPLMLGGYCLYSATRSCTVFKIKTAKGKSKKLPLSKLEKSQMMEEFNRFTDTKLSGKIRYNN